MIPSSLDRCPNEIIVHIFWLIADAPSTLSCRLLNRRYKGCIDTSSLLQYAIRLDAWGYEDHPVHHTSTHSISGRQKALEAHMKSWATLDWEEHHISIPRPEAYNLTQGHLITVNKPARNTLTCVELPSRLLNRAARVRRLPHVFNFPVETIIADPSQDLLIGVERYVNLSPTSQSFAEPMTSRDFQQAEIDMGPAPLGNCVSHLLIVGKRASRTGKA